MSDWLGTARVLQRRLDDLAIPARRQTMVTACLEHSKTFARLACFLAGPPHDDIADYDRLEDEFIEAMQGFQETYQKVRQMKNSSDTGEVEVEEESSTPSFHRMPSPDSPKSMPSSVDGTQDLLDSSEDTLGEIDELESMGSQRSDGKQWDPQEDFYMRAQVSLIADLQDPLFEQLHRPLTDSLVTPLLEELTSPLEERLAVHLPARLAASTELLESLTTSLTQHNPLLDALAARMHERMEPLPVNTRDQVPAVRPADAMAPSQSSSSGKRESTAITHEGVAKKPRSGTRG